MEKLETKEVKKQDTEKQDTDQKQQATFDYKSNYTQLAATYSMLERKYSKAIQLLNLVLELYLKGE